MGSEQSTPPPSATEGTPITDDSPKTYDAAAQAEDLRTLVEHIEALHPEPYRGYDGRLSLHAALEEAVRTLPDSAPSEQVYRQAAPLIAGLEDAHSRLEPPDREEPDGQLPLSLRVVGDAIYIDGIYDESVTDLLGGELLAVAGEPIEAVVDRLTTFRGYENQYFARLLAANRIADYEWFDRLLNRPTAPEAPTIQVRTPDSKCQRQLSSVPADAPCVSELDWRVDRPEGTGPRYTLLDGGDTALFVPGNLTAYREVLQAAGERDAGYAESVADRAYQAHFGEEPPADLETAVAELPSMVEAVIDLVKEMNTANTEALIVDVRDNPGGDSRFVQYLGYALYGLDTLVEHSDWGVTLKRRTPAHRERYGVPDGARDEYATFEANPASYDFGPRFRTAEQSNEERRQQMEAQLAQGIFSDELENRAHEAYYEPRQVTVVTTAGTMSSAFGGAALLSELGADIVGVPPGQAPISFGEAIEVDLPNTGLTADIAGSAFQWVQDPEGNVLPMTRTLTPDLFENRYDRAGDAALRLALDHVRDKAPRDP